ncbi:SMI1/KNR4 family protein [Mucilaginibacter rubeus]|uniref:SMI1/KNR4 family protein n=1 Tax=Mucilaginibacter rubeus TaxID=2027860 RepID=A0A5C1I740_9SPHI|nr:SMI1/KNR4 family protein [Mucilaginibacter rubeus]QEM12671.1 SMI1/KNR4 family protein [Mucilaginibacter rubeus]
MHLIKSITDIINYLKNQLHETDITLYAGATDLEIYEFEISAGVKLPDDIRQFYQFTNGFMSDEDLFRIVPLNELIHSNSLYIAEFLIYSDLWELIINPAENNYYEITCTDKDQNKLVLTTSFFEFIQHFLIGGVFEKDGLYDWTNAIAAKNRK